jgi:hypothetical protein
MCKIECASGLMRSIVEWTVSTLPVPSQSSTIAPSCESPIRLEPNIRGVPKILCATAKSGVWRSYRERITRSDLIEAGRASLRQMNVAALRSPVLGAHHEASALIFDGCRDRGMRSSDVGRPGGGKQRESDFHSVGNWARYIYVAPHTGRDGANPFLHHGIMAKSLWSAHGLVYKRYQNDG